VLLLVALGAVSAVASTVSAQEEPPDAGESDGQVDGAEDDGFAQSIGGRLTTSDEDGETVPIEGVDLTVSLDGTDVGSDTSDDDGRWRVEVPAPGAYSVQLDPESLPDGVVLRSEAHALLESVRVESGQNKQVRFLFGERVATSRARWERFANLAVQGVKFGSIIALAAVGLSLIYGVTGLVNFAHGELVAFGALIAWFLSASAGGPGFHLVAAALLTLPAAALLGAGLEGGLWRPLRRRRSGRIALLVVAIGLALVMRHLYLIMYGGASRPYVDYTIQRPFRWGPLVLLPKDVAIIGVALAVLLLVALLLLRTRTGTAMRAVADNKDLSEASGIDVEQIIMRTWMLGAALAALGGILQGIAQSVTWNMGFTLLLLMFAAVVVGGLGTAFGVMAGGLVIGVVSEVSTYWFSTEFKLVFALGALIAVLLVRPQGIFGRAERIG
jgi:branched-chain amino acid transport system permease protein